jgi:hypothetical protein
MLLMAASAICLVSSVEVMGIPRYLKDFTTSIVEGVREGEGWKGKV